MRFMQVAQYSCYACVREGPLTAGGNLLRIFLSFHSKDHALAEALREGLLRLEPAADIFLSSVSLRAGFWMPKLAEAISAADAFLLLIGPAGIGPWQELEYQEAIDRHVHEKERFPVVPLIAARANAPGLPFLLRLNWVEAPVVTEDKALHRVLAAVKGEAATSTTPLWKLVNPYRGLEAMTETNADYFHGRHAETAAVLSALGLKRGRCPVLIGASGVGKSSVARAGVLSALKSMQWPGIERTAASAWPAALSNSRGWLPLVVRPGELPLQALAATFIQLWQFDRRDPDQAGLPRKWAERLSSRSNNLADLIDTTQEELRKREGEAPERVLLYLDQGEELYTRAAPQEARRFSEILAEGLVDRRLFTFASLRADYFDRFQSDEPLFKCHEHVNVPPLDRAQLLEVVTAPARALDVLFEDDKIAERITHAAAAEQLPLLSYLLHEMWDDMLKRGDATLRLSSQAIDVGGVLRRSAEDFLATNPADETALRRLLTLRLATVPSEGEVVRRQTTRDECSKAEWSLAGRLADYPWRLVVTRERPSDGRIVAEVTHETFLRAWPRLREWLRGERDFLIFKGDAERAERRWREMEHDEQALLTGLDLTRAEEWLPTRGQDLSGGLAAFIQQSIVADREKKQRELAEKERQIRFQRRVSMGAVAAALVLLLIGALAWVQWGEADRARAQKTKAEEIALRQLGEAQITQSLFLASLAAQERLAGDAINALLLGLGALPDATWTRPYVPEAEFQLDAATRASRERLIIVAHKDTVRRAAFSPDGKRIVTASSDRTARLWDAESGKLIGEPLRGHEHNVYTAAFSPDGKRIVTASWDKTARLWDVESGKQIGAPLRGHEALVSSAAFSPDGKRIVTGSWDKTARLWDVESGKPLGASLRGHAGAVSSAAFSPDGKRIVTASSDKTARLWDAESGNAIGEPLRGHEGDVFTAEISPDAKYIVTASTDKTARLWDSESGKPIGEPLRGHRSSVFTAAFSPDGKRIITASGDNTVQLWDVKSGRPIGAPLRGHESSVFSAAFSPDGKRIVTASADETARLWDIASSKRISELLVGHESRVLSAAFSPDGKRIVTTSEDKTARLWDVESRKPIGEPLRGHEGRVWSAVFSPDGKRIVTASEDKTARLWDAESRKPIGEPLLGHGGHVLSAAFSPDGKRIVTGSDDRTAQLWNVESGRPIGGPLRGHEGDVFTAGFSPDGKTIVTASSDRTARLWDVESGKPLGEPLRAHQGNVFSAAFSPDGKRIVTASGDHTARLWDVESGKLLGAPLRGHFGAVSSAAFSPDGKRIITASWDKTARLWDAESGKLIGEPLRGHEHSVLRAAFSPDGKRIVTASADNTARLWEIFPNIETYVTYAQQATPRCLSQPLRKQFFLPPEPPAWCIEMKKWPYHTSEWSRWLAETRVGKNPPLPTTP
jgi:WD40 repeat protein